MDRDELIKFIEENVMTPPEVMEYLGISKQRLANIKDKLAPIKKGIYLRVDVEARKVEQVELREKFYRR